LTDAPRDRVCALRVTVAALVLAFGRPIIAQTEPFEAIAAQAAAAREAGELERAVDMYRRALSLKPNWPEGLWYLGTTFFELQRYAESRAHLGRLLTMQPEHAGALGLSGLCSFHLQQYEDALRDLVRARALGISQTPALAVPVRYHLAILLTRFSDFEVGYAVLSEFAVENNGSAQVIAAFGLNLLRKPLLPSEVPAEDQPLVQLAGRAAFAMAARRSAEARRILDELAATFPRTPNVHYARGVFRLTDAPEQAVEDLSRARSRKRGRLPKMRFASIRCTSRRTWRVARCGSSRTIWMGPLPTSRPPRGLHRRARRRTSCCLGPMHEPGE
jgi:tetratricopeptide (TPR) repeat protein